MKKLAITAVAASFAWLVVGAAYAEQGAAGQGQMQQEQKQTHKQAKKAKCPKGEVYSKKDKKCVAKQSASAPKSPAAESAPMSPAAETAPGAAK